MTPHGEHWCALLGVFICEYLMMIVVAGRRYRSCSPGHRWPGLLYCAPEGSSSDDGEVMAATSAGFSQVTLSEAGLGGNQRVGVAFLVGWGAAC